MMATILGLVMAGVLFSLSCCQADAPFRLRKTSVTVRYVRYGFALRQTADGVPRFDWTRFQSRPRQIVDCKQTAIVLENRFFRATILPAKARIRSFLHKATGHEQLWINPAAIPIPAHNDTGFWMTWGGIECVLPRGEHGTSHALRWRYRVEEDSPARKAVRMWVIEPLTGLKHTLIYAAYPDRPYLETAVRIYNPGKQPQRFSHWTTAALAPGGRGQITPRTELIVPAAHFVAADKPFNGWMQNLVGPVDRSPLRFVAQWKDIGDLMASPLKSPFYAAYCHEEDEALVRVFDLRHTPGFDIWMWGFPPNENRQREYTAQPPNLGYVEFWNGTAKDFSDNSLTRIAPGQTLFWTEKMYTVTGLRNSKDLAADIAATCP
jgi:hypothetical protein